MRGEATGARGNGDAGLDRDQVGVGSDGDLDGLAGVRQADLDLLPADHDRPADGDPAADDVGFGQAGRLGCARAGSAQPGPGLGRDEAGEGAGQDPGGQDVGDRAVEPQGHALPGQRQPGADDAVAASPQCRAPVDALRIDVR